MEYLLHLLAGSGLLETYDACTFQSQFKRNGSCSEDG